MEYAVLLFEDETTWTRLTAAEQEGVMAAHDRFTAAVTEGGGQVREGEGLEPTAAARSLRWTGGQVVASDGPYAETVEQLGGFYVVEAPDLDRVMAWCRLLPHHVEIRPTVVHDDDPAADGDGVTQDDSRDPAVRAAVLLYGDEQSWVDADEAERAAEYARHEAFATAVIDAGGRVDGGRELAHSSTATTLRQDGDGGWLVTDGPFTETVEQLSGYYLLTADRIDTIESLLHHLPGGTNEIRPVIVW